MRKAHLNPSLSLLPTEIGVDDAPHKAEYVINWPVLWAGLGLAAVIAAGTLAGWMY